MKSEKRPRIQTGYRSGALEVIAPTGERKGGYTVWRCRCSCGQEILLDTRALQRGAHRDCGCQSKVPPGVRDLTGMVFGRLTALEVTERRSVDGAAYWRCRCGCGRETLVLSRSLTSGNTKSCGCLGRPARKDFVGRRFGALTVLAYEGKWAGMHRWRCRCDCGQETVVGQTLLQSGKTRSCGCRQREVLRERLKLVDGTSVVMLEAGRKGLRPNNTSGCTGVYRDASTGKWKAEITFKGTTYYLGSYTLFEDAVRARRRGEELHEDFLDWYYATYGDGAGQERAPEAGKTENRPAACE